MELIVNREARKLGLDPSVIDCKYKSNRPDSVCKRNDRYEIHIADSCGSTAATVRHELYHIYRDREWTGMFAPDISIIDYSWGDLLYYILVAEPRATLYGNFGIRL